MRKAAHPSGGMDSSNPRRWRGERLHHHGDGVCHVVCAFCAVSDLRLVSRTRQTYILEVLQSGPPRLAPYLPIYGIRNHQSHCSIDTVMGDLRPEINPWLGPPKILGGLHEMGRVLDCLRMPLSTYSHAPRVMTLRCLVFWRTLDWAPP